MARGQLTANTIVSTGAGTWQRAGTVPGLRAPTTVSSASGPAAPPGTQPPGSVRPQRGGTSPTPIVLLGANQPPPAPSYPYAKRLIPLGLIVGFGALAVYLISILPTIFQWNRGTVENATFRNLAHLAQGTALYTADHDDRYPLDMASANHARHALSKYIAQEEAFESLQLDGEIWGNEMLSGVNSTSILHQDRTVLFYEAVPFHDRYAIVFANGKTDSKPEAELNRGLGQG